MPEVRFVVRWPDRSLTACYSPSTVVWEFLAAGESYPLPDFRARCRDALAAASERVRARYGFPCSLAARQAAEIEEVAARFAGQPGVAVTIEASTGRDLDG